jgi:fumarylacetoacetate (FAA) hydrolase family protein
MHIRDLDEMLSTLTHKVRDKEMQKIGKLVKGVNKDICDHWRYGSSRLEMKQMLRRVWLLNEKLEKYGMWVDVVFD